jgi:hypothetical protein
MRNREESNWEINIVAQNHRIKDMYVECRDLTPLVPKLNTPHHLKRYYIL